MVQRSAGLLMYRFRDGQLEVLLVHPGGPYWEKKDAGAWSIPKGEYSEGEDALAAAEREFFEETGVQARGDLRELGTRRQPSGKKITVWAFAGDCDAGAVRSNTFRMEWPPRSGREAEFPEVDRAQWFSAEAARAKLARGQVGFVDELCAILGSRPPSEGDDLPPRTGAG